MTNDGITAYRLSVPSGFVKRIVTLSPREQLPHRDSGWCDAIVFVTAGEIEVACTSGEKHRFGGGDILSFARLDAAVLCTAGDAPARVVVIHRKSIG